jgi:NAD(P)-dependent dehydrogenase (short-subunit alcohol dehydrogenase family)
MTSRLFDISGKVAVVTGAGRGLCRAAALAYAEAGAKVACVARSLPEIEETARLIADAGGEAIAVACDIADRAACDAMVATVVGRWGRVDIGLLGAAITVLHDAIDATPAEWEQTMLINVVGAANSAQAIGRQMMSQGGGALVLVSSNASTTAFKRLVAYNASKAGVDMLVRTLAVEWADHGIRVNAIAPGYMDNIMRGCPDEREDPRVQEEIDRLTPMRRVGSLDEFCGPALFFASDASGFVTGQILVVDGGYTAQ